MNHELNIEIVSDLICPWCFIGKRRLESALQSLKQKQPDLQVKVTWKPFELNPQMPREGMDRRAYRSAKFGSWEKSQQLDAGVTQAGREEGLEFAHEKMERTPNTFDGHRVLWLALHEYGAGMQNALAEALFKGYFTQGKDVGNRETLVRLADECGMNASLVIAFLESNEGEKEVRAEEGWASQQVSGVPFFIVNRRFGLSGAQPAEHLLDAMEQALAEADAGAGDEGETEAARANGGDDCEDGACSIERPTDTSAVPRDLTR